jgi:hypothetical protein
LGKGQLLRAVSQEAEVTDAHETIREDVEQEAADKFAGLQRHRLFSIPISSISIAQGDFSVLDLENTVVGQRHAVSVATEVIEHGVRRAKRLFGVDDPALFWDLFRFFALGREFSSVDVVLEQSKKLSSKDPAQSFDGEEKVFARRYPAPLIQGQSAGGNQTVQMKMIFKRLIPRVQHGDDSKGSLKVGLTKL